MATHSSVHVYEASGRVNRRDRNRRWIIAFLTVALLAVLVWLMLQYGYGSFGPE
jgi:hypothetical protein